MIPILWFGVIRFAVQIRLDSDLVTCREQLKLPLSQNLICTLNLWNYSKWVIAASDTARIQNCSKKVETNIKTV